YRADRVSDRCIQERHWEGDRGGRSHRAELEFLAGECKGRSTVAIGVVTAHFGQLRDSELDHYLVSRLGTLSGSNLLDDLGKHVAHENGDDCRRRFVGAEAMLVS